MDGLTEIVFVIDRSGSMAGLESDTVSGFNSFLSKQKEIEGGAVVTAVLFNDRMSTRFDRVDIKEVPLMAKEDYIPGGGTALLDAVGSTVDHIRSVHAGMKRESVPSKTVVVIITDGYENSSRDYTYDSVKHLIEQQKKDDWEFVFLGANIDVAREAARMGINRDSAFEYDCTEDGLKDAYVCACKRVAYFRD